MSKEKQAISPASAKLKSCVWVKSISPKYKEGDSKTVALVLTPDQAVDLAAKLLSVAKAENAKGEIYVTGHKHNSHVTVIRKK